jgi:predicted transcriptional regulator
MDGKRTNMAQTSVIIPDDIYALLQQIAGETGRSISSLCSDFIKDGVYQEIENLNKVETWKKAIAMRNRGSSSQNEP